ncbi:MAG: BACON domain-containing protein, partial [Opitutaceae bacterium]
MNIPSRILAAFFALLFCASAFALTSITPASHEVGAGVVTYQILVRSDTDWTATKNTDWVMLSSTSGPQEANILVTVSANTTGADRSATIQVNGETHTLTQRSANAALQEVWAFGLDGCGQLGDNNLLQRQYPSRVTTDVKV